MLALDPTFTWCGTQLSGTDHAVLSLLRYTSSSPTNLCLPWGQWLYALIPSCGAWHLVEQGNQLCGLALSFPLCPEPRSLTGVRMATATTEDRANESEHLHSLQMPEGALGASPFLQSLQTTLQLP